jgi:hypothetical protein
MILIQKENKRRLAKKREIIKSWWLSQYGTASDVCSKDSDQRNLLINRNALFNKWCCEHYFSMGRNVVHSYFWAYTTINFR